MNTLVVFDSQFGNTKTVAETIAQEVAGKTVTVSDFTPDLLSDTDLLIVGSPIIGWKPSERMGIFLSSLKPDQLKGIKAAAFDTRVTLFFHGDAAGKIAKKLTEAGAEIVGKPQGFNVLGKEGPLAHGELEKAITWAREICDIVTS